MRKIHPTKGVEMDVTPGAVHPNLGLVDDWPDPPDNDAAATPAPSLYGVADLDALKAHLDDLNGEQLADECRARGLKVSGTNAEKRARVVAFESPVEAD